MPKLSMKYTLCIKYKIKILQNNINFIFLMFIFWPLNFLIKRILKRELKTEIDGTKKRICVYKSVFFFGFMPLSEREMNSRLQGYDIEALELRFLLLRICYTIFFNNVICHK